MSARPSLMAVTVYQPWAFLLAAGYKPLENRDWRPTNTVPLGSRMAIHAGMKFDPGEVKAIVDELQDTGVLKVRPEDRPLTLAMLGAQCGHILSVGRLAGIVTQSESPYFVGKYGWVFDSMVRLPVPVAHRGAQGLWPVSAEVLPRLREEYAKVAIPAAHAEARDLVRRFSPRTALDGDSVAPPTGVTPCP